MMGLLIWLLFGVLVIIPMVWFYISVSSSIKVGDVIFLGVIAIGCLIFGPIALVMSTVTFLIALYDNRDPKTCWVDKELWRRKQ